MSREDAGGPLQRGVGSTMDEREMLTDRWLADKCAEIAPKHEPDGFDDSFNLLGFARDLRDAILAARRTTPDRESIIEECAKVCEGDGEETPDAWDWHSKDYAKAIRALKAAPTSDKGGA